MSEERLVPRATAALLIALPLGFDERATEGDSVRVGRASSVTRVSDLTKGARWDEGRALALVAEVAKGLEAFETRGLFPGTLVPEEIAVDGAHVHFRFDSFVAALAGEAVPNANALRTVPPRDTPPEVLSGESWSNRDNRYALGLVAYRLLAGEHPFAGLSLRALEKAQLNGPAPFAEDVARALSPGVMSFVLSLLSSDAALRPRSAREVAARAAALSEGAARPEQRIRGRSSEALTSARSAMRAPAMTKAPRHVRPDTLVPRAWVAPALGLLVGMALALYGFARRPPRSESFPPRVVPASAREAVGVGSASCKACHVREFEEWQRSVMSYSVKSPLFGGLESAIEEEAGRSDECPNGAGILRHRGQSACRAPSGEVITGAGGEGWCQNCHAPLAAMTSKQAGPAWSSIGDARSRQPLTSLLTDAATEGISCTLCHATIGPVGPHRGAPGRFGAAAPVDTGYEGNPTWRSFETGRTFFARPEDLEGRFGIANSGYSLDVPRFARVGRDAFGEPGVHTRPSREASAYQRSSEFCGSCHDVRLFGTDAGDGKTRGESFKRLRNAYTEWRAYAEREQRAARTAPTCQDCHMSLFPGICERGDGKSAGDDVCPPGTRFAARPPGSYGRSDDGKGHRLSHFFTSVDVPMAPSFPEAFIRDATLDPDGVPLGLDARRTMLLRSALTMHIHDVRRSGGALEIPITVANVGAGHKVPAGFSQERELWIELVVKDERGRVVYEVGRVDRDDEDLHDKRLVRVRVSTAGAATFDTGAGAGRFDRRARGALDPPKDAKGRPLGIFGADVTDGPDVPEWRGAGAGPAAAPTRFVGKGLVNFQNGFQRCVRCIGFIDAEGRCQAGPGQGRTRADRFDDGDYDLDTGECRSNLIGVNALFETYLPVGALDADRGVFKAPDAIIDTRALAPGEPVTYTFRVAPGGSAGPFSIDARLRFRAFPPYLIRTFAAFEAEKARLGLRPSTATRKGGPQVDLSMLTRVRIADLASAHARLP